MNAIKMIIEKNMRGLLLWWQNKSSMTPCKLLLLLALVLTNQLEAVAACSTHVGKVVFNEVYIPNSGTSFVEIKVLDPSVLAATSNFQNWQIDMYDGSYANKISTSVSSGFTTSTTNSCGQTSLWIRFPETVLSYLDGGTPPFNFVLHDTSGGGQIVDILRVGDNVNFATSFYENAGNTQYTSCTTIESQLPANGSNNTQYDAQQNSGASVKDWFRVPDGTGPWDGQGTSNPGNTTCGTNAGGGGTYGVSKVPSTTAVLPNTNFSYTLYSINGATAVSSPASVVISDNLTSAGLVFVSCTTARGTCTHSGGVVTWTVGAVAANTSYTATLTVTATTTGAKINSLTTNVSGVSATATAVNVINPLLEFRMEEAAWNGTTAEVNDNLNVYNATAASLNATKPTTLVTAPAVTGDPGTCRYGVFNRTNKDYLALPSSFPNLGAQSFTIAAWIKTTNNSLAGQRVFVDDQNNSSGFGFSLGDGGTGRLRFFSRGTPSALILDTANVIASNTWYFVAAVADVPNQRKFIYVFSAAGALLSSVSTTWTESSFGSDSGPASIGGETNASGENSSAYGFAGNIDEVHVYQAALNAAGLDIVRQMKHACPGTAVEPAGFNCIETGAAADTGRLYTKLAGTDFSFDVAALNAGGTAETGYVAGSNKNVTVELFDDSSSPAPACNAYASPVAAQTLSFASTDAGRKATANFNLANAYSKLRCRVKDETASPTIIYGCSTDDFSVRPTALTVTSNDATGDASASVTAATVIKAGANFNLTATAIAGYNGTPKIDTTKVFAKTGANGALIGSFAGAAILTGISTSASTTYSEVGYFNFAINGVYDDTFTAVDQSADCTTAVTANYSNVRDISGTFATNSNYGKYGCNFGNTAASNYFGRFIPDHFDTAIIVSSGGVPMACPSGLTCPALYYGIVYAGQAFTTQITARNLAGATTTNYNNTEGYSKLVTLTAWDALGNSAATLPVAGVQNPGLGSLANSSVLASAFGNVSNGVASPANTSYSFSTIPTAPTAIYLRAQDTDSVTSLRAIASSSIEGGVLVVNGRIKIANAYGSELLPLSLAASAQYYNGSSWLSNTSDAVTTLTFPATFVVGAGTTAVTLVPATGVLSGGVVTVKLGKPTSGAGIATIAPTTPPGYLPVIPGTATFGIYNKNNNFIYQRENY